MFGTYRCFTAPRMAFKPWAAPSVVASLNRSAVVLRREAGHKADIINSLAASVVRRRICPYWMATFLEMNWVRCRTFCAQKLDMRL